MQLNRNEIIFNGELISVDNNKSIYKYSNRYFAIEENVETIEELIFDEQTNSFKTINQINNEVAEDIKNGKIEE